MAVKSLDRLLLLWATLATTIHLVVEATPTSTRISSSSSTTSSASDSDITLSSNITSFIPSCALSCFESFIEANFNTSICGTPPSLQCLCQQTGSSGYTIGEGATECIVAEANIGNCDGDESSSEMVDNAYGMCDGQTNAAPETHATLTATLVVVSGSVFVPNTKTTSTKSSNISSSTSVVLTTSAASTAASTSTLAPSTSSFSSTSSTAAATTTTSTPTSTAAAAASKKLSAAQIGGIAGGVAAAAILAALFALFIFLRRRRRGTGFSRVRDSWTPKHNHMGSPGSIPTISAPMYEEPKVMSFTRALAKRVSRQSRFGVIRPGTIGLAISPAGAETSMRQQQQQHQRMTRWPGGDGGIAAANATLAWTPPAPVVRRYSPEVPQDVPLAISPGRAVSSFNFFPQSPPQPGQSPPPPQQQQQQQQQATPLSPPQPMYPPQRPNLTVAIPPPQTTKLKRASTASNRMTTNGRDSIVTEFAEDGEDMTVSALGSALIWRPPNTDANSATTYYVADKWGNWVLGGIGSTPPEEKPDVPAELETPISKTVAEREADEVTRQHKNKEERQRKQVGTDITKHSTDLTDSEAVKAAMRHLSSPTIPESVALRNLGGVASGSGPVMEPSTNRDSIAMPPLRPTIRLVTPESGRLPVNSRSSSVYSNFTLPQSVAPGADKPMPRPVAPAGVVTVSKRASRAYPAATRDPTQLGIHPALRPGNNIKDDNARPPMRRKSNSGNTGPNYNGGRRDRSQTMMSQDSTTTIASSMGDSDVDVDDFPVPSSSRQSSYATTQRQSSSQYPVDLSPVIESPGRSPVRYPQIPRSRSSAQIYATAADKPSAVGQQQQKKPVNPAIRKIQNSGNMGPSSDSPTLGTIGTQRPQMQTTAAPSKGQISYYQSPPRRSSLNPGVARVGSPNSMTGPDVLTVQKHQRAHHQQPQEPVSQSYSPSRNNFSGQREASASAPHPQSFQTRINNRSQLPSQSHSRYGPSSVYDVYNGPSTTTSRSASEETVIHTPVATSHQALPLQTPPQTSFPSPPSATSEAKHRFHSPGGPSPNYNTLVSPPSASPSPTGSSSALLSKRLGPEKAATFQVPVDLSQRKWARRQSSLPPSSTNQPAAAPAPKGVVVRKIEPATSSRNTSEESNKENKRVVPAWGGVDYEGEGYENETQSHEYYLPATPGWKPQLTPKRRGDDLYLSVQ